jgi:hypothetical protein
MAYVCIVTKIEFRSLIELKQLIESKFTLTDDVQDGETVVVSHSSIDLLKYHYTHTHGKSVRIQTSEIR